MAHIGSVSKMRSVTRMVPHTGSAIVATQMRLTGYNQPTGSKNDLCSSFSRLGMTPVEACMSAQVLASVNTFKLSHHHTQGIRLPSLIKPMKITVPTLYGGILQEKDLPPFLKYVEKIEPTTNEPILETPANEVIEKQAARLVVIRRKKMKKHKLKKLRKKMKFIWLKVRQKREYRKEKRFQAIEMTKVRQFESFDAVQYVADVLRKTKEKPIPKLWKGKALPQPIIIELMKKDKEKKEKRNQKRIIPNFAS